MEDLVAGLTQTGTWGDVVEHGEKITAALQEETDDDAPWFTEWNSWRPKLQDDYQHNMRSKTAEHASKTVTDDTAPERTFPIMLRASRRAASSLQHGEFRRATDETIEVVDRCSSLIGRTIRAAQSTVESTIYMKIMTTISPYYFDNKKVNANLSYSSRDDEYKLQVSIADSDLHQSVSDTVKQYNKTVERWHISSDKRVHKLESTHGTTTHGIQTPPEDVKDINTKQKEA